MNRREFVIATSGVAVVLFTPLRIAGQKNAIEPDLGSLADGKGLNVSKRTISRLTDGSRKGIRLSEAEGEGPAYLPGIEFANGTIELDIKGKARSRRELRRCGVSWRRRHDVRRDLLPSVQLQD